MNPRGGIYSLTVGSMAVALISLIVFSTILGFSEMESEDYLAVMRDVRIVWQNTMLVFDSAVYDAAQDVGCTLDKSTLDSTYFTPAINSINSALEPGVDCTYTSQAPETDGSDLNVEVEIECSRQLVVGSEQEFRARFLKTVVFEKPC